MSGLRVLLLEDNNFDVEAIRRLIETQNLDYELRSVSTCGETRRCLKEATYDVVLLDSKVPDGPGLSILPDLDDQPAIIITGQGDEDTAVKALKEGASDYLVKDPAGMYLHLLPTVVEAAINKKHLKEEKRKAEEEREKLIVDLEKAHRELKALSRIDPLTRLSNRRDIKNKIEYEISRFERSGETFSIILGDIDRFKEIHSKLGDSAAKKLIVHVAERFIRKCRKVDTVGRWGTEAFMVIVPETNLSGAETLAENLRKLFDEKISLGIESIKITASFGVAAYVEGLSVDGIADNAESFLLKAKASGGDKVVCFPSRVNG
ncbi:MAG: diguanylate cyclase [Nitrospinae bacterium]|nr:diguanylate cyclase [Nitrospinota bacterium]